MTCKESCENDLRNLLAVIHRDGGHYSSIHGISKACKDAEKKYYAMMELIEKALQWFNSKSPLSCIELEQHLENPTINTVTDTEKGLSIAIANYLKEYTK